MRWPVPVSIAAAVASGVNWLAGPTQIAAFGFGFCLCACGAVILLKVHK